MAPSLRSSSNL